MSESFLSVLPFVFVITQVFFAALLCLNNEEESIVSDETSSSQHSKSKEHQVDTVLTAKVGQKERRLEDLSLDGHHVLGEHQDGSVGCCRKRHPSKP